MTKAQGKGVLAADPALEPGQTEREMAEVRSEAATEPKVGREYEWGPRPALDGLRAVAVYAVVLFHGGVAAFGGGFIGVDLFFVLSGFLVTNVILLDFAKNGRLRLARFYARRMRRLFPASALAILGTAAVFLLVAPPVDRIALIGDARAAFLYFANWHFIGQANDYFAAEGAAGSPFLHYWSLSIEEQFYFVFPLTLLGLAVLARRTNRASILPFGFLALALLSLAAQLFWIGRDDALHAYYGSDARLYQLLAGATLAGSFQRWGSPERFRRVAGFMAPIALVTFVFATTSSLELSASLRGIVACVLSVFILASLEVHQGSLTARGLSRRPIVYLGRISYGTYLWHWPVIIAAERVAKFGPWELAAMSFVIGTALAALSHELIEMPVRRSSRLNRMPRLVIATGLVGGIVLALVAVPALLSSEYDPVVSVAGAKGVIVTAEQQRRFGSVPDGIDWEVAAAAKPIRPPDCSDGEPEDCIVVSGSGAHIHLLGDSHARMLMPTFQKMAERHDLTFSASFDLGCAWQTGLFVEGAEPQAETRCSALQEDQHNRVIPGLDPDILVVISVPRDDPIGAPLGRRWRGGIPAFREATAATVDQVIEQGPRLVILEHVPFAPFPPLSCLSGAEQIAECSYEATPSPLESEVIFRYEDIKSDKVFSVNLDRIVCPHFPLCVPMLDGQIIFRDVSHIHEDFAATIDEELFRLLEKEGVFEGLDKNDRP